MEKTCKICGQGKDASEFYAGVNSRCKDCHKAKVRENRSEKIEYYRAYDAKRFKSDHRVKDRHRRYQSTVAGKASMKTARDKFKAQNPEKRAAHVILGNAVRDGRAIKPDKCQSCGAGGRIHGHHHDYTRPLDVMWLCPKCHTEEHKRMKNMDVDL